MCTHWVFAGGVFVEAGAGEALAIISCSEGCIGSSLAMSWNPGLPACLGPLGCLGSPSGEAAGLFLGFIRTRGVVPGFGKGVSIWGSPPNWKHPSPTARRASLVRAWSTRRIEWVSSNLRRYAVQENLSHALCPSFLQLTHRFFSLLWHSSVLCRPAQWPHASTFPQVPFVCPHWLHLK